MTENCGILHNLLPGDIVLADRGFDIAESVGLYQAQLHIPAFTTGKSQLLPSEVQMTETRCTETRAIANVLIHVERVIGFRNSGNTAHRYGNQTNWRRLPPH